MLENFLNEQFQNVLHLLKKLNKNVVNSIYGFINAMPYNIKKHMQEEKACSFDTEEKHIDLIMSKEMLELFYERKENYLEVSTYIFPFYEEDLERVIQENKSILLCSYTISNSEKDSFFNFFYKEIENNYKLQKVLVPKGKTWDFVSYVDNDNGELVISYSISVNGLELIKKSVIMNYDEMVEYAITDAEAEFEEDVDEECVDNDGFGINID